MPTTQYSIPMPGVNAGLGKKYLTYLNQTNNSPKVNGKLALRANEHSYFKSVVTAFKNASNGICFPSCAESQPSFPFDGSQYNETYAKWVGKLHKGGASLGVTLGSWTQTRAMIVDRFEKIGKIFKKVEKVRKQPVQKRRINQRLYTRRGNGPWREYATPAGKQLASNFLEGEFGWVPLLADVWSVVGTVFGDAAIPPTWCRASSSYQMNESMKTGNATTGTFQVLSGTARVTISAKVEISNPNLWAANRLGITNPLTVAWDLVPWSFVVNMFVNIDKLISSLSDTVGLSITNGSTTMSSVIFREFTDWRQDLSTNPPGRFESFSNVLGRKRSRTLGTPPRPSLQFKLPKLNLELAAIAASLLRIKVTSLK